MEVVQPKVKRTVMKVTLSNGKKYSFVWYYQEGKKKKHTQITVIDGHDIENGPIIETGKAWLHKGDVFNKNTGRLVSLTKMLTKMFPNIDPANKTLRMEVWEAYKKMRGGYFVKPSKLEKLKRKIAELTKNLPAEVVNKELRVKDCQVMEETAVG